MNESEVIEALERSYARLKSFPRKLERDDRLIDDLGLDSVDSVEMLAEIEDELGVELTDMDEAFSVRTVGDLADLLTRLTATA